MNTYVKICGITNYDDASISVDCGADALGFIFHEESPRFIHPRKAASIISRLPNGIQTVGVFVNRPRADIENIIGETGINVIQLHGDEPPHECYYSSVKTWKAVRHSATEVFDRMASYRVDAFLLDTFDDKLFGGTGKTGDWQFAKTVAGYYKVILAGGLHSGNIIDAVAAVQPFGVDINSGVESSPGIKDKHKIIKLFDSLKAFNNQQ